MAPRVAVVGAGSWGTTVAAMVAERAPTVLWARRADLAHAITATGRNPDYLGGPLPRSLVATPSLAEALVDAEVVLMAVPSHGFRSVLRQACPHLRPGVPVISLAKGVEEASLQRMTEIVAELAPGRPVGVLTGPNLAGEIAAGQPAASVIAASDDDVARELQALLSTPSFRVYTNPDVVGCELAGALKNVVAIACGMADGMGLGDNTRAALITRGLAELSRLGTALGGQAATFAGLAGMGDLVVTCISPRSRNRFVGQELGAGRPIADIVAGMSMVAEGVKTSRAVLALALRVGVDTPIAEQVVAVVDHAKPAAACIGDLMERLAKPEHQEVVNLG